jgi:hypothetical protein
MSFVGITLKKKEKEQSKLPLYLVFCNFEVD